MYTIIARNRRPIIISDSGEGNADYTYEILRRALRARVDEAAWNSLNTTTSVLFE